MIQFVDSCPDLFDGELSIPPTVCWSGGDTCKTAGIADRDSRESQVRAKKPSLTLNLGTNGLKVTSEQPPTAVRRAACKNRIAQQSPIQAAATLDVALSGYRPITVVPATLRHWQRSRGGENRRDRGLNWETSRTNGEGWLCPIVHTLWLILGRALVFVQHWWRQSTFIVHLDPSHKHILALEKLVICAFLVYFLPINCDT
ncbi:hypothetical protein J6590_066337 [Homalodisca vitripennis]|nr:hypothetical protein J6590_066337 [Homalodisca vitripennis]